MTQHHHRDATAAAAVRRLQPHRQRALRVLLVTWGSEGDIRPFLGLARALRQRGHEPVVAAGSYLRERVTSAGIRFHSLGAYANEDLRQLTTALGREPRLIRHPRMIAEHLDGFLEDHVPHALEACREADVVISHSLCLFGLLAAEVCERPCAVVHPFPSFLRGDGFLWNGSSAGTALNRILWSCTRLLLRSTSDPAFTRLFHAFQIAPRRDVLLGASHSRWLNLLPFSRALVPVDPRWGSRYEVTGYWSTDQEGALSAELRRFLSAGPPPAVFTFGSMTSLDAARVTETIVSAAQRAGVRAVLQSGAAGLGSARLPDSVFLVQSDVPHLSLFQRAACVVHHGGAGTTGTTLRAGVPQIVTPLLGDQAFWARRLQRAGVLSHWKPMSRVSLGWLTRALVSTVTSAPLHRSALALAARVAGEDGATRAVELLEAAVGTSHHEAAVAA